MKKYVEENLGIKIDGKGFCVTSMSGAEVIYPNSSWKKQVGGDGNV